MYAIEMIEETKDKTKTSSFTKSMKIFRLQHSIYTDQYIKQALNKLYTFVLYIYHRLAFTEIFGKCY